MVSFAHTLAVAEQHGAYNAARKALAMSPAEVTDVVLKSGLRGVAAARASPRAGSGASCLRLRSAVASRFTSSCNADESEPGHV
jgi:NADH:ubiquinone oxidoreductase subunit F (NADH-binding)